MSSVLRFIKDGDLMIQQFSSSPPNDVYDDVNIARGRSSLQVDLAMKYPEIYLLDLPTWLNREDRKRKISTAWSDGQSASEDAKLPMDSGEKMLSKMEQLSNHHQSLTLDFPRFPNERLSKARCHL